MRTMSGQIEFSKFYKKLRLAKKADYDESVKLKEFLSEYIKEEPLTGVYDELGRKFCEKGIRELTSYTGLDDISKIGSLARPVWEYLELRNGKNLFNYIVQNILEESIRNNDKQNLSSKWKTSEKEIDKNTEDLAKYITEGIVEIII